MQRRWVTVLVQVRPARIKGEVVVAEPLREQASARECANRERQIETGITQAQLSCPGDQLDAQIRVLCPHASERWDGKACSEAVRGRDPDRTDDGVSASSSGRESGSLHRCLNGARMLHDGAPCLGEVPSVVTTPDEPSAERFLQRSKATRHGGVVDPECTSGSHEATGVCQSCQVAQIIRVHVPGIDFQYHGTPCFVCTSAQRLCRLGLLMHRIEPSNLDSLRTGGTAEDAEHHYPQLGWSSVPLRQGKRQAEMIGRLAACSRAGLHLRHRRVLVG